MNRVAVVGGGLAGLVAARRLAERDVAVTLYERAERVGGRVGSDQTDGFTLDRGFQVLFPAYPAVKRELDLDALELGSFRPGAVLVRPGERSILSDPLRDPWALTPTLFNRSATLGDAWRLFGLRRELARTSTDEILTHDDRSVAEALEDRGFSADFVADFAAPFLGGITLDRSLSSAEYVFEYAFKMLFASRASVPRQGMQAIPDQLAERARTAGVSIQTGSTVEAIESTGGGSATVTTSDAVADVDGVVVATDPDTAVGLTGIDSIPTEMRGCVTQHLSLPTSQDLGVDRRLLLNAASDGPNHVAVLSAVVDEYAPADRQLLSATFLGVPDAVDATLTDRVVDALTAWFPENSFTDLEPLATHRISTAQLAQPPGYAADRPSPDAPEDPVVLAGDYTRWSSIQGALESGRVAAETLLDGQ